MSTLHEKSPCCRGVVHRFGGRRRQCSKCKRTWRAWRRRRGPAQRRKSEKVLLSRLVGLKPIVCTRSRSLAYKRFRETLEWFVRKKRVLRLPRGPYILIADGLWFRFGKETWVLYLVAVRPVHGEVATFLDPVLLPGKERAEVWEQVLEGLPSDIKKATIAFVSDAFKGSRSITEARGWRFQSCQFHALARFHVYRGRNKRLPGARVRTDIWETMRTALIARGNIQVIAEKLTKLSTQPHCHHMLARRTRGFVRDIDTYRTYLQYPNLNLPVTTGTVEAMNSLLRGVLRRLRTPSSVLLWATAFIRLRPHIRCNGK